jgi:mannose-6-phosphate isomerase
VKLEPIRLEPEFSPRIWGARSLTPLYPERTNLAEPIGEAWLTGYGCHLATGPLAGRDLRRAWQAMPAEWRGIRLGGVKDFPLLIKFIFPMDKLSIQVHPDDAYAAKHEAAAGGRGKTEMWYAVSAEPGAELLLGLKPGVDKQKFRAALSSSALETLFQVWPVDTGDTFFVPAQTPHTIGPGMVLCEIQQYSDITYRVYDYGRVDAHGRLRELHIEKALEVMNFGAGAGGKVSAMPPSLNGGAWKTLLAACVHFAAERWEYSAETELKTSLDHFDVLVILGGSGELGWKDGTARYQRGEAWLVPAALGRLRLLPADPTALLRVYAPDLKALRNELKREGHSETTIAHTVFG